MGLTIVRQTRATKHLRLFFSKPTFWVLAGLCSQNQTDHTYKKSKIGYPYMQITRYKKWFFTSSIFIQFLHTLKMTTIMPILSVFAPGQNPEGTFEKKNSLTFKGCNLPHIGPKWPKSSAKCYLSPGHSFLSYQHFWQRWSSGSKKSMKVSLPPGCGWWHTIWHDMQKKWTSEFLSFYCIFE